MCGIQCTHRVRKENSNSKPPIKEDLVKKEIKLLICFHLCVLLVLYKQAGLLSWVWNICIGFCLSSSYRVDICLAGTVP
jgi:hypothetical protein